MIIVIYIQKNSKKRVKKQIENTRKQITKLKNLITNINLKKKVKNLLVLNKVIILIEILNIEKDILVKQKKKKIYFHQIILKFKKGLILYKEVKKHLSENKFNLIKQEIIVKKNIDLVKKFK